MNERGEALQHLETKFADLSSGTSEFVKKIKEYNKKQVISSQFICRPRKNGGNYSLINRLLYDKIEIFNAFVIFRYFPIICPVAIVYVNKKMANNSSLSNNYADEVDDSSSSSEDEGRFGFWGAGGGSSGSLSKFMAKRERQSQKDLQKELAVKRESEFAKEKADKAKLEEQKKSETLAPPAEQPAYKSQLTSSHLASGQQTPLSQQSHLLSGQQSPFPHIQSRSLSDTKRAPDPVRPISNSQSQELSFVEPPANFDAAFNNAMMAAYITQAVSASNNSVQRSLPRETFDNEPELPDSVPSSKILRRIGAYRNWSEQEIQADLTALEFHRLRTVKDMRELSYDGWKEIKELLPLVRELLIKEVFRGRSIRQEVSYQNAAGNSISDLNTPQSVQDVKNIRAPTSTPMDSPDMNQRRTINVRQW